MGGNPPLGYDPKNRELIKNNKEAEIVKTIYQTFLETGSITETVRAINTLGQLQNLKRKSDFWRREKKDTIKITFLKI